MDGANPLYFVPDLVNAGADPPKIWVLTQNVQKSCLNSDPRNKGNPTNNPVSPDRNPTAQKVILVEFGPE